MNTNRRIERIIDAMILVGISVCGFAFSETADAQTRLSIKGPEVVEPCQLVRLEVQLNDNESALWIVEPNRLDYEIVGSRLIFSLGCEVNEARILVVAASVKDGVVNFRQLRHRVRVGAGPNPPPVIPGDPVQPTRDWTAITNWIEQHPVPDADQETAANWSKQLKLVAESIADESLEVARKRIGEIRRKVFVERSDFKTDWNPFLIELDRRIKDSPPKNLTEYRELILAISRGLEP